MPSRPVPSRAASCVLASLAAAAAILLPPWQPASADTVGLSTEQTYLTAITDDIQVAANSFANAPGGTAGLLTLELEDDYDAVQIGVENQFTSPWGIDRVVVSPSANYGGERAVGSAAYDLDGIPLKAMLPAEWPASGPPSGPPGAIVLSLPTTRASVPGENAVHFASTVTGPEYGSAQPAAGWFATDGLGCLAPGTTVVSVNATAITLSAAVTGSGCALGQAIYFSPRAFDPFSALVPAATSQGNMAMTVSDWIPMRSLPRTDGGFTLGATVDGPGVPAGTTLAGIGPADIVLSQGLTSAMPAQSPLHVHINQSLAVPADASTLTVSVATGIHVGQTVTTPGGEIAPRTHVASVTGNIIGLDQPVRTTLAAGKTVSFLATTWTMRPAAVGATQLEVPSTTQRPLLHIRYFTQPHGTVSVHQPSCLRDPVSDAPACEGPLGLPSAWTSTGAQTSAHLPVDGINFVRQIGAGAGTPTGHRNYLSFFVRILGRHAAATLLVCGGFQSSGANGSVSGEASIGRLGASLASLLNPAVPIPVLNVASHQNLTTVNQANCSAMVDAFHPAMALIQDYSNHNNTKPADYRLGVRALAEHALQQGTRPIIYLAYVEAGAHLGALPVASDVVGNVFVPLSTGIAPAVAGATGQPLLVTGPGIPIGTTAIAVPGSWHLRMSQPVSVSAGTVLHYGYRVASSSGTAITLQQPSFFTHTNLIVHAPGIPANSTLSVTQGSTAASLNQPATLVPGTALGVSLKPFLSVIDYTNAARWYYTTTEAWATTTVDAFATIGTDPAHPRLLCDGCTTNGGYANDHGNALVATQLVTVLQRLTGQIP